MVRGETSKRGFKQFKVFRGNWWAEEGRKMFRRGRRVIRGSGKNGIEGNSSRSGGVEGSGKKKLRG